MVLPKNTAAKDAAKDQGLLSEEQVEKRIQKETAASQERDAMWAKVAAAKTPAEYKKLIDESVAVPYLLELLETDNARTTILTSARLSPAHYLKLKQIIDKNGTDLKQVLSDAIDSMHKKLDK
jgi:hypothetical protein